MAKKGLWLFFGYFWSKALLISLLLCCNSKAMGVYASDCSATPCAQCLPARSYIHILSSPCSMQAPAELTQRNEDYALEPKKDGTSCTWLLTSTVLLLAQSEYLAKEGMVASQQ
jgi:hypothetical protein